MILLWMQEDQEKLVKSETFAIRISNVANMVLFAAKVYASVRSGSLAIIASTLDSLLDLLSGFILWFTAFSMQTPNPYQYPIGKKRMQPLVSPMIIQCQFWTYISNIVVKIFICHADEPCCLWHTFRFFSPRLTLLFCFKCLINSFLEPNRLISYPSYWTEISNRKSNSYIKFLFHILFLVMKSNHEHTSHFRILWKNLGCPWSDTSSRICSFLFMMR